MPKLSKREIEKKMLESAAAARQEIARKELVQFRLEPEKIVKLFEIAGRRKKHLSEMLREWVSAQIELEERREMGFVGTFVEEPKSSYSAATKENKDSDPLYQAIMKQMNEMSARIEVLESEKKKPRR